MCVKCTSGLLGRSLRHSFGILSIPQAFQNQSKVKIKVILRRTVSRTLSLGIKPLLGPRTDVCYYQTATVLSMHGVISDDRTDLSFVEVIVSSTCHLYPVILLHEFCYYFCYGHNSVFSLEPIQLYYDLLKYSHYCSVHV
jgi:hypothetical protein